jgi:hypothetical protein
VYGCGSQAVTNKHIVPHLEDDSKKIGFCPYGMFEDLRERFSFMQKEDSDLYSLITGLPFETSVEDLKNNLSEL